jgi:hypothetical protein
MKGDVGLRSYKTRIGIKNLNIMSLKIEFQEGGCIVCV